MTTNLLRKFQIYSNSPEPARLVRNFRIGIALITLLKIWPNFPLSQNDSWIVCAWLLVAICASVALLFDRLKTLSLLILILLFSTAFSDQIVELRPLYMRAHHVQLLIFCFAGLLLTGRENNGQVPGVGLKFLRFTTLLVYCFAILIKLNPVYLSGIQVQQLFYRYYWGSDPIHAGWFSNLCQIAAWISIAAECAILVGLVAARRFARPLGYFLHAAFFLLLPVSTFSVTMILLLTLFIDNDYRMISRKE